MRARYHGAHYASGQRGGETAVDFLRKALPTGAKAVGRYLQGVRFPIRKQELVAQLERNGVPGPILSQVRKRLPEKEYRGPQDVLDALRGR
ncbi:MAG: hypothetical protein CYG60_02860 [Actinobacteria bacterium]|nr:MAG: hypothetical protein CYG60_02860 [Actinomycetota bacterium]